ncbi:adenosine 5'-monophosphoramidase HINT3-like [Lucilia cuprina]|uniref:adenosine 5'-monophosphoramidase HINT3-like n=1 Tax=Lucilia cuprina TaxID=7375 RepID=UPI001F06D89C|nr:adenosine 5'-monophosphoramidase HINT3-like [Lucilia cuprina]
MKSQQLKSVKIRQTKKFLCLGVIGLALILLLVVYASTAATNEKDMAPCIFCDIVAGKSPNTKLEVETDEYVIFKDIKPASTYHYLCVTKRHIESLKVMTKEDIPLVNRMEEGLKGFFKSQDIDLNDALFGFHMPPFISVKHLHMHGIAPRSNMSWTNSFMFKPSSYWFKTVEDARQYLQNKS